MKRVKLPTFNAFQRKHWTYLKLRKKARSKFQFNFQNLISDFAAVVSRFPDKISIPLQINKTKTVLSTSDRKILVKQIQTLLVFEDRTFDNANIALGVSSLCSYFSSYFIGGAN